MNTQSQLAQVKAALNKDKRIEIVKSEEHNHLPNTSGIFSQFFDFIIAPALTLSDTIKSDIDALQDFSSSLIPNLPSKERKDFHAEGDRLWLGSLLYIEKIGTEEVNSTQILLAPDVDMNSRGFIDGELKTKHSINLKRRVRVVMYPSANVAKWHHSNPDMAFIDEYFKSGSS